MHYMLVKDPGCFNKWGQIVTSIKEEEPPYVDFDEIKLLNVIKTQRVLVDSLSIALYFKESKIQRLVTSRMSRILICCKMKKFYMCIYEVVKQRA